MNLKTTAPCPVCCTQMEFLWETVEVPHFGEAMIVSGTCQCGFRHSDTMLLTQRDPMRYLLVIDDLSDLDARIIRSSSGTIRLPEIGVDVEPGPASECYISNVEGVLNRVKNIVRFATRAAREAGDQQRTSRGEEILGLIDDSLQGRYALTLILEDPFGNSAIISDNAVATPLTMEEAGDLKTGMVVLDV